MKHYNKHEERDSALRSALKAFGAELVATEPCIKIRLPKAYDKQALIALLAEHDIIVNEPTPSNLDAFLAAVTGAEHGGANRELAYHEAPFASGKYPILPRGFAAGGGTVTGRAERIGGTLDLDALGREHAKAWRDCAALVANGPQGGALIEARPGCALAYEFSELGFNLSDYGLDDAPLGISIWEGTAEAQSPPFENPLEIGIDYEGAFRRLTAEEAAKVQAGEPIWGSGK